MPPEHLQPRLLIRDQRCIAVNPVFTQVFGYTAESLEGLPLGELLTQDANRAQSITVIHPHQRPPLDLTQVQLIRHAKGFQLPVLRSQELATDHGEQWLEFRVLDNKCFDAITGLPNGWAANITSSHLMQRRPKGPHNLGYLIVCVNNFSTINYRFGFEMGDRYLTRIGARLTELFDDAALVVRFSNAKFGVLLEGDQSLSPAQFRHQMEHWCKAVCALEHQSVELEPGIQITKSFSVGVSSRGDQYRNHFEMEVATEIALQASKRFSTSRYTFASPSVTSGLMRRKILIDDLPQALAHRSIELHFQPQYDLSDGKMVGLEALSRWTHPSLGAIPPDEFVALAETIGLHLELDSYVLNRACEQRHTWLEQGLSVPRIAVNFSARSTETQGVVGQIAEILRQHRCPAEGIEIEVTETSQVNLIDNFLNNVRQCNELGLSVALDDFGSGYSSLGMLHQLKGRLGKLKLDRELISGANHSEFNQAIITQVVDLAHLMNAKVVAEGVETLVQCERMNELGCELGQGYYLSRPLPAQELALLLALESPIEA